MLIALKVACKKIGAISDFCFSYKNPKKQDNVNKDIRIVRLESF